jgi:hypothetical protein
MLRLQWRDHDTRAERRQHSDVVVAANRDTRNGSNASVHSPGRAVHAASSATHR